MLFILYCIVKVLERPHFCGRLLTHVSQNKLFSVSWTPSCFAIVKQ